VRGTSFTFAGTGNVIKENYIFHTFYNFIDYKAAADIKAIFIPGWIHTVWHSKSNGCKTNDLFAQCENCWPFSFPR